MTIVSSASRASSEPRARDDFAVLIPAYNEHENVEALFAALAETFRTHGLAGDVVFVDDGSTDDTPNTVRRCAEQFPTPVIVRRHARNLGKTEALVTGVRATKRRYVVLLDADLQYDPDEIPRFLAKLDEGYDLVTGRKVGAYDKRVVSGIYNWLSQRLFDVPVGDLNGMKACRRVVLADLPLRHDWHRYFVVLAHSRAYRLAEIDVAVRPRFAGSAKYESARRIPPAIGDLLVVWFGLRVSAKPMHFFGGLAAWLLGAGGIIGAVLVVLRAAHVPPPPVGYRPILGLVALLIISGIALFGFGVVGELVATLRGEVEALRAEVRRRDSDEVEL